MNSDIIKGGRGGLHFMKWFHKKSLIWRTMASLMAEKKNTIFKLSFPKSAGSIPWDGDVH